MNWGDTLGEIGFAHSARFNESHLAILRAESEKNFALGTQYISSLARTARSN
jgi:hypothetical protein